MGVMSRMRTVRRRSECVLVAFTNFAAIFAILSAWQAGRLLEALVLYASMIASLIYHLAKRSTNHMEGFTVLAPLEHILHRLDLGLAISAGVFMGWMHPERVRQLVHSLPIWTLGSSLWTNPDYTCLRLILCSILCLAAGELGHFIRLPVGVARNCYIVFHSLWHLLAFAVALHFPMQQHV